MTTLTISIVTYHVDRRVFLEVLESLSRAVADAIGKGVVQQTKLIIVDNGDDEEFLLESITNLVTFDANVIANKKNIGFGRAHNLVLKESESDLHLVLNPDAILQIDALTIGCRYLRENKETVMVGPFALKPDGSRAYLCKRYPSILDLLIRGFLPLWMQSIFNKRLAKYECHDYPDDRVTKDVLILSGCCMLARTESLTAAHGFDKDYFLYFEDFHLSLKITNLGSIDYLPQMRIVHVGGGAAKKGLSHIMMFCRSAFTFYNANGWKLFSSLAFVLISRETVASVTCTVTLLF